MLAPADAGPHFWLARAYQAIEAWDAAIVSYRRYLERKPDGHSAHWSLGVVYAALGRGAEAITCYTSFLRGEPDAAWRARAQQRIDSLAQTGA